MQGDTQGCVLWSIGLAKLLSKCQNKTEVLSCLNGDDFQNKWRKETAEVIKSISSEEVLTRYRTYLTYQELDEDNAKEMLQLLNDSKKEEEASEEIPEKGSEDAGVKKVDESKMKSGMELRKAKEATQAGRPETSNAKNTEDRSKGIYDYCSIM